VVDARETSLQLKCLFCSEPIPTFEKAEKHHREWHQFR